MSVRTTLTIGSRASDLALWQSRHVRDVLRAHHPTLDISIEIIHTTGDKILDLPLATIGGKGVFTKELESALLAGEIDIAVHSLKDLPTELPVGLTLGAIPMRANVEDVFLAKDPNSRLMDLPDSAIIATGSLRRKAQLLTKRPDFRIVDIRGNVPTRIRKLMESNWDGMVLARAGVERLGLTEQVAHTISLEWVLPAAGQGALGIECRSGDDDVLALLAPMNDMGTLHAVTAERALLATLGGGCQAPIGAHGKIAGYMLELSACIAAPDGRSLIRAVHTGDATRASKIGEELAWTLLDMGGNEILRSLAFKPTAGADEHPEA